MTQNLGEKMRTIIDNLFEILQINFYGVRGILSGDRLLVTALREGAHNIYAYKPSEDLVKLNRDPIYVVAEPPKNADRVVFARDVSKGMELVQLYTVHVDRPGEEVVFNKDFNPIRIFSLVDKGDKVYVSGVGQEGLVALEVSSTSIRRIGPLPGMAALLDVYKDTGVGLQFSETGRTNLFVMDLSTGEANVRDLGGSLENARFTPDGMVIYAVERGGVAVLEVSDPWDWSPTKLELPAKDLEEFRPSSIHYFRYSEDKKLIVIARREGRSRIFIDGKDTNAPKGMHGAAYEYMEGLVASHTSLTTPTRIIALENGEWKPLLESELPDQVRKALGESSFHWVDTWDGSKMPVYTLRSGLAQVPGPTVLLVHGGPFAEDADIWDFFAASLAVAGFHVVMTNYRGSMGYGEEWRNKIIGDPCGGELRDVIAAREWAVNSGLASRVYVMGYSYGGYLTLCALTRYPGKFLGGVAGAGITDWEQMYNESDEAFKKFIDLMFMGDRSKWKERSPITYVDNLRDPLCIVHSQNDSRTPLKPVIKFIELASEKGKSVEAHIVPDMGHSVNTVDDLVKLALPAVLFLVRLDSRN